MVTKEKERRLEGRLRRTAPDRSPAKRSYLWSYKPLRPQITREIEKVKLTIKKAQPRLIKSILYMLTNTIIESTDFSLFALKKEKISLHA